MATHRGHHRALCGILSGSQGAWQGQGCTGSFCRMFLARVANSLPGGDCATRTPGAGMGALLLAAESEEVPGPLCTGKGNR